jgi:hypothetical protein
MPGAPFGPVLARTSLRTQVGWASAIAWATNPPREKPKRSTLCRPSASRNAIAGVVEGDHVALGREAVDQSRVPVVDVAAEVLQQDERDAVRRRSPDATERVGDAVGTLDFL